MTKRYWVVQHGSGSVLVDESMRKFGYDLPRKFTKEEVDQIVGRIAQCHALQAHDCIGCGRYMLDHLNPSSLCHVCERIYKVAYLAGHEAGFEKGLRDREIEPMNFDSSLDNH